MFSLLFNIINNIKEVNPSHLHILLSDKLLISYSYTTSSFIFRSKLFHFVAIIRGFKNSAFGTNQNMAFYRGQTPKHTPAQLYSVISSYLVQRKLRGRGNLYDKEGKMLHSAVTYISQCLIRLGGVGCSQILECKFSAKQR
jgi:hypothetical protein